MSKQTNRTDAASPASCASTDASEHLNASPAEKESAGNNTSDSPRHSLFSRILAVGGIIIILALYIATLFFALFDRSETMSLFLASVVCTIVVPVLLYVYNWIYRLLKNDREDKEKKEADKRKISDIIS